MVTSRLVLILSTLLCCLLVLSLPACDGCGDHDYSQDDALDGQDDLSDETAEAAQREEQRQDEATADDEDQDGRGSAEP